MVCDKAGSLATVRTADPREAVGPPWPRLVGGATYRPSTVVRRPILVSVVLLALSLALLASVRPTHLSSTG
jgi:hypothetical protein